VINDDTNGTEYSSKGKYIYKKNRNCKRGRGGCTVVFNQPGLLPCSPACALHPSVTCSLVLPCYTYHASGLAKRKKKIAWPCFTPPHNINTNLSLLSGYKPDVLGPWQIRLVKPRNQRYGSERKLFNGYKILSLEPGLPAKEKKEKKRLYCLQAMFSVIVLATAVYQRAGSVQVGGGGGNSCKSPLAVKSDLGEDSNRTVKKKKNMTFPIKRRHLPAATTTTH
jgi:hypothetical protein